MYRRSTTWPVLAAAIAFGFARPTSVAAVSTECNLFQPSHICPSTTTYGDVNCGVAISAVRLYCKAKVTAANPVEPVPDNIFENCNSFDSEGEDCCLAPTETGGIRLINFLHKQSFADAPAVEYVLADYDFVTPGDPLFDVNIRGVQLSAFDLQGPSIEATTCSDTKVRIASLRLYVEANHDLDEFTVTVAARDGRVESHSTTFTLSRQSGEESKISYSPKIRNDVSEAGTIRSASNRTVVIYNPTAAPTVVPTAAPSSAPTAPTATPTKQPTVAPPMQPTVAPTLRRIVPSSAGPTKAPSNAQREQVQGSDGMDMSFTVVAGLAGVFCCGMLYFAHKSRQGKSSGSGPHANLSLQQHGSASGWPATGNPLQDATLAIGVDDVLATKQAGGVRQSLLGYLLWGDRRRAGRSAGGASDGLAGEQHGRRRNRFETRKSRETVATFGTQDTRTSYLWSGSFTSSFRSKPTMSVHRFLRGPSKQQQQQQQQGQLQQHQPAGDILTDVELRDY
jgi:hypothetical protein